MQNIIKKNAFWAIQTVTYLIDIFWVGRKSGWLFYGYNGQPTGNNFALLKYCISRMEPDHGLAWAGKVSLSPEFNDVSFRQVPDRHAPIRQHISFLLFVMKFEVISVEAAGDLRFYLQFLPRKKRLLLLLPHGFCLKAAGVLAVNLSDEQRLIWGGVGKNFDLISASSQIESYILSATLRCPIENVLVVGQQRQTPSRHYTESERIEALKVLTSAYEKAWNANHLTVYAPTHRDHLENHQTPVPFGFPTYQALNEMLIRKNSCLLVRSHALGAAMEHDDFSNIIFSSSGPSLDFNLLAPATDLLITDYSGIFIDFLLSQIDIAFWQYDFDDYRTGRGFSISEEIFDIGSKIDGPDDFEKLLGASRGNEERNHKRALWAALLKQNDSSTSLELTLRAVQERTHI